MMRVIHLPRSLLLSSAALFVLVPIAVLTRAVFSSHAWWDPPLADLALCGWAVLGVVAPISWRLAMGRRGACLDECPNQAIVIGPMIFAIDIDFCDGHGNCIAVCPESAITNSTQQKKGANKI